MTIAAKLKLSDVPIRNWRRFAPTANANERYVCKVKHRCAGRYMLNKTEYCVYASEDSTGVVCKWALRVDGDFMGWWDTLVVAKRVAEIKIYCKEIEHSLGVELWRAPIRKLHATR